MRSALLTLAMLAALSVAFTAPSAYATGQVTLYHLTITVTANGHTSTSAIVVPDVGGTGVITVPVSSGTLSQINGAFGTTTFAFPGSYTGTFTFSGTSFTVTLSSTDTFTLKFVLAQ